MTLEIDTIRRRSDSKIYFRYWISDVDSSNIYDLTGTFKKISESKYEFKIWMELMGLRIVKILSKSIGYTLFHLEAVRTVRK